MKIHSTVSAIVFRKIFPLLRFERLRVEKMIFGLSDSSQKGGKRLCSHVQGSHHNESLNIQRQIFECQLTTTKRTSVGPTNGSIGFFILMNGQSVSFMEFPENSLRKGSMAAVFLAYIALVR